MSLWFVVALATVPNEPNAPNPRSPPARADFAADSGVETVVVPVAPAADAGVAIVVMPPEAATDGGVSVVVVPVAPAKKVLSTYKVDIPAEAAVTASAFFLYFLVDVLIKPGLQTGFACTSPMANGQCDPTTLSSFDRYAIGRQSPTWRIFGDVVLGISVAAPIVYLALESALLPTDQPWRDFANDAIVLTESLALSAAFDTVLKFAFRRPRPSRYEPQAQPTGVDAELSLPSGHTEMVTAAATMLTATVFFRHPGSGWGYVSLGIGSLLATLTAISRVQSGQHFPTDVLVGMVIGGFSGFLVPYIHRTKELRLIPSFTVEPATGATSLTLSGSL